MHINGMHMTIWNRLYIDFALRLLMARVQITFGSKTAIFPVSLFLLLFSRKFSTDLENYQYDSFK